MSQTRFWPALHGSERQAPAASSTCLSGSLRLRQPKARTLKTSERKNKKLYLQHCTEILGVLRAIPKFEDYPKSLFVELQAEHEGKRAPFKKDYRGRYEMLFRFALRHGLEVQRIAEVEPYRHKPKPGGLKKRQRKPNRKRGKKQVYKNYDGNNGFTKWREVRYQALRRSSGKCDCCGASPQSSGQPLHVDHIKPKSLYPDLEFDLSNLQVLCADCNIGKGNWDETNWRDRAVIEELDIAHIVSIEKYLDRKK